MAKKGPEKVFPELRDGPSVYELAGRKLGVAHSVEEIPERTGPSATACFTVIRTRACIFRSRERARWS